MSEAGWTSKKPIVAGWYWWRTSQGDTKPWVVKVQRIDMDMMQMWMIGNNEPVIIGDGGEWLGPITPDDRQQGRVAGLVRGAQLVRWHKSCAFEADPAFALERAAKDIESVASQIIQPQQAQEGGVGE